MTADTVESVRPPNELAQRFRSEGRKFTPQRELVIRLVFDNPAHPTADGVFAAARLQMPMISLKTVYQVLNDLAEMGEVHALDLGTGSIRFDPNTTDHHHALCATCGMILDVAVAATPELVAGHGFVIHDVDVTFRGTCASCLTGSHDL